MKPRDFLSSCVCVISNLPLNHFLSVGNWLLSEVFAFPPCSMWKLQVSAAFFTLLVGMLPIYFPSWLVWRPGWKRNTWWTLELCLCDNHTLCESLSMQIDPNNVNNVEVPTLTEEAGKKADLNWTFSESSLSFEWEIMIEREDCWEYPDLKCNWLWCLECDMTIDM